MNQRVKNWISLIAFVVIAVWAYNQFGSQLFDKEPQQRAATDDDYVEYLICKHNPVTVECSCANSATGEPDHVSYQECVQIAESQRNR